MKFMVSVIIPALNEEHTIAGVVKFCYQDPLVSEVIVVDDKSADATVLNAATAGARVITSEKRGKGISMRDGIMNASNEILVFLDADIQPYPEKTITGLASPLVSDACDFVKGAFSRNAGRVTELVAKPLLKIFFPELSTFQQPLSGMIAGKKSFMSKIDFFTDYGVDVGILIDMFLMQARIQEVNIGYIENKSKPWQLLGKMSGEVSKAIIRKAAMRNNSFVSLDELGTVNIIAAEMKTAVKEEMQQLQKIVVFDMDNTLLRGRFIDVCAEKFFFTDELRQIRETETDAAVLTKRIAKLLAGLSMGEILQTAAAVPVVEDAAETVSLLKESGAIVGIISDSYQMVADFVKNKTGANFAIANRLEFFSGKATGEVIIPSWFYNSGQSICRHAICKTNALMHIARRHNIPIENCIAVGDGLNDLCMITHSGMGIAFCSREDQLRAAADKIIDQPSFSGILSVLNNTGPQNKLSFNHCTKLM
jgi:glucosyl-3-phosphoglycerate synthase